ncbi:MAG: spermidine/putrescine ABC transporter substrate-binding protein [Ruminococcus sp.]|nr:spermidine/putrescine ABC transporter substrate-binding protein [Ruminococcus sp.]
MKKIICLLIVCLLTVSCCLCLGGCKKYDSEINVYNWGEFISDGSGDTMDVIAEFEKKYNIKVNYTTYETNETLYNMLASSNSSYDVVIPSDYMIEKLIAEDLIQEINFDNIPNYKNIADKHKNMDFDPENKFSVPYSWGVVALCYNKTMVDGEVKGFSDLWRDDLSGEILMFNNSRDAMAIAMQLTGGNPTNASKEDIDNAYDKLIEQKPLVKKYVMDMIFSEMEGSQAAIAPYYAGDIYTMMGNNEDLDYCLPEEGSNMFMDSMCIPTCANNKEGAEKFINFMLEAEVAKANAEYIGYSTPNTAAFELLSDDMKNNELIYPSEEYLSKCYTFSNLSEDVYNYMQEKFIDIGAE